MSALEHVSRMKHIFKEDLRITIINALVFLSRLYHCFSVRSNTTETNITKLQSVQNFAVRIVSDSKTYDHVSSVLKRLKWLPVYTNLYFRDTVMAFKCMRGIAQEYLGNKFISRGNISGRADRTSQQFNIPLLTTKKGQRPSS